MPNHDELLPYRPLCATSHSVQERLMLQPHLDTAQEIIAPRATEVVVDGHNAAVGQHGVFARPEMLQAWRAIFHTASRHAAERALDQLMLSLLPQLRLNGQPILLKDLFYMSLNLERGAYFPNIHWDAQWGGYPMAPGFNVWYVVEPPAARFRGEGNMFIVEAPPHVLKPEDPPFNVVLHGGGVRLEKAARKDGFRGSGLPRPYASLDAVGLRFHYLNLSAGDVLVFSKRTLHMSDPRPMWHGLATNSLGINRVAMNVRVILRPPGWGPNKSLPFNPAHPWFRSRHLHGPDAQEPTPWSLAAKAKALPLRQGHRQLPLGNRFAMLHWGASVAQARKHNYKLNC